MTDPILRSVPPARSAPRRLGFAAVLLCALAAPTPRAQSAGEAVATARASLEQMVATRRQISAERRDWELGRVLLQERIELAQREIAALRARAQESRASLAETERKHAELQAEAQRRRQAAQTMAEAVAGLEQRTLQLLARLPDPIREHVRSLSQRLPGAGEGAVPGLIERYRNLVGILNEVDKFHRLITRSTELRELGDGSQGQVTVTALYLGISFGCYVSGDGRTAGVGSAGADGWVWTRNDQIAGAVQRAVAMLANEQPAEFIEVPVRIQ